jgi:hypothetical protein
MTGVPNVGDWLGCLLRAKAVSNQGFEKETMASFGGSGSLQSET